MPSSISAAESGDLQKNVIRAAIDYARRSTVGVVITDDLGS